MADLKTHLSSRWDEVIKACEKQNKDAATFLYLAKPVKVFSTGMIALVTLETRFAFHRDRMNDVTYRNAIQYALAKVLDSPVAVDIQLPADATSITTISPGRRRPTRPSSSGGIRSIPTVYKGVQFRSRLEAKTAELLDTVGLDDWLFEAEGYDLGSGVWYLPDFYLPRNNLFLEVKGILDEKSEEKVIRLASACAGTPNRVMLLYNVRPRLISGQQKMYIAGSVVNPDGIIPDSMFLVRCPKCTRASWKVQRSYVCPLCGHKAHSLSAFPPAGVSES